MNEVVNPKCQGCKWLDCSGGICYLHDEFLYENYQPCGGEDFKKPKNV